MVTYTSIIHYKTVFVKSESKFLLSLCKMGEYLKNIGGFGGKILDFDRRVWYTCFVKNILKGSIVMKAVISVIGKDTIGIIHKVSAKCAEAGANIVDISQSVMKDFFSMVMVVEIDALTVPFVDFVDSLTTLGKETGLEIHAMHEDIFAAMHKI